MERNLRKAFVTSTALDRRPPVPLPEVRPRQRQGQHQGTELPVSDSEPPAPRPVRSRVGLLKETVHRALRVSPARHTGRSFLFFAGRLYCFWETMALGAGSRVGSVSSTCSTKMAPTAALPTGARGQRRAGVRRLHAHPDSTLRRGPNVLAAAGLGQGARSGRQTQDRRAPRVSSSSWL